MQIRLRDYQEECIQAIISEKQKGIKTQLAVLPTGSGKTIVFSSLIDRHFQGKRVLILAHRDELIQQAKEKYEFVSGDILNTGILAGNQKDFHKRIVIGSVQTVKNYLSPEYFHPENFDCIIVDEAHHSSATTYTKIFEYFQNAFLIGFTATPVRSDDKSLGNVFEKIIYQKTIHWMINHEPPFLTKMVGIKVETGIDISKIRTTKGDFKNSDLDNFLNTDPRNEAIVEVYKKLCNGDKAIVFCINKEHTRNVMLEFYKNLIKVDYVDSDTPKDERRAILKGFAKGDIQVLCNCGVLTEGYDEPTIQSVILARPTKSEGLYTQMVGRGTRLHPSKQFVKIIDIVDNAGSHKLRTIDFILQKKIKQLSVDEVKNYPQEETEKTWQLAERFDTPEQNIKIKISSTALFDSGRRYNWIGKDNYYFVEIKIDGVNNKIEIKEVKEGLFNVFANGKALLEHACGFSWAFGVAEDYLNSNFSAKERMFIDNDAAWKKDSVTKWQMTDRIHNQNKYKMWQTRMKQFFDISEDDYKLLTKGQVCDACNYKWKNIYDKHEIRKKLLEIIETKKQGGSSRVIGYV